MQLAETVSNRVIWLFFKNVSSATFLLREFIFDGFGDFGKSQIGVITDLVIGFAMRGQVDDIVVRCLFYNISVVAVCLVTKFALPFYQYTTDHTTQHIELT